MFTFVYFKVFWIVVMLIAMIMIDLFNACPPATVSSLVERGAAGWDGGGGRPAGRQQEALHQLHQRRLEPLHGLERLHVRGLSDDPALHCTIVG